MTDPVNSGSVSASTVALLERRVKGFVASRSSTANPRSTELITTFNSILVIFHGAKEFEMHMQYNLFSSNFRKQSLIIFQGDEGKNEKGL